MVTACEYCGAPVKGLQACEFSAYLRREGWSEEAVGNWQASGADPPCYFDEYDEWQRQMERRDARALLIIVAAGLAIGSLIIWLVS